MKKNWTTGFIEGSIGMLVIEIVVSTLLNKDILRSYENNKQIEIFYKKNIYFIHMMIFTFIFLCLDDL